jgi:hypothetical protein
VCVIIEGFWIGECIYWRLIHTTGNYKLLQSIFDVNTLQNITLNLLRPLKISHSRCSVTALNNGDSSASLFKRWPLVNITHKWLIVKVKVKVKVMLRPTVQSASLSWNKAPHLWINTRFVLFSDSCRLVDVGRSFWREDGSVVFQTQSAVISLLSICTIYIFQVIKYMYIQHIRGLCQSRLSTADHALLLVAPAITSVYSLERSYAWPPPSLSLLYFLTVLVII